MLTDLQRDILTEILNTNIGRAASALSEMVNQKVVLSVPYVDLQRGNEVDLSALEKRLADFSTSVMSAIRFGKAFSGHAYIIIPVGKAKELVNACTQEETDGSGELTAEDFDVIREISNVILNCLIGEFGNLLHLKLEYTLPDVELTMVRSLEDSLLPDDMHFLTMFASFLLSKSHVRGMIFVALSGDSESMLLDKINDLQAEIYE